MYVYVSELKFRLYDEVLTFLRIRILVFLNRAIFAIDFFSYYQRKRIYSILNALGGTILFKTHLFTVGIIETKR